MAVKSLLRQKVRKVILKKFFSMVGRALLFQMSGIKKNALLYMPENKPNTVEYPSYLSVNDTPGVRKEKARQEAFVMTRLRFLHDLSRNLPNLSYQPLCLISILTVNECL